jgi:hypothetical protein
MQADHLTEDELADLMFELFFNALSDPDSSRHRNTIDFFSRKLMQRLQKAALEEKQESETTFRVWDELPDDEGPLRFTGVLHYESADIVRFVRRIRSAAPKRAESSLFWRTFQVLSNRVPL